MLRFCGRIFHRPWVHVGGICRLAGLELMSGCIVFPPAYKKGMVKFPRKGHFQRAAKCNGGTFKRAWNT